jgi:glycosyltransferase involved in cell wall biosynthesis
LKITIFSPTFGGTSGIGRHTQVLTRILKEKGYEVDTLSSQNTPFIPISKLKNISWAFSASLKKIKGDIIHAHNLPSILPTKIKNKKTVLTLHGYYSEQITTLHGQKLGRLSKLFEKGLLRWPDNLTCVSKKTAELYRKMGFQPKYIPNAVDYHEIRKLVSYIKPVERRILYVGRTSYEKGFDIFQKLMKTIDSKPEYNFLTVQNRPWEETIKLIASAKILIVPSRVEGLPTVILEALACGTPVIASNIEGVNEIIENEETGILFQSEDLNSLTDKIKTLDSEKDLYRKISRNGLKKIELEYDWNRVIGLYENLYHDLLNN